MSTIVRIDNIGGTGAGWAALALAGALAFAAPAAGDTITVASMLRGISSTPAQCAEIAQAVWVTVKGRGFCMRFYFSGSDGETRKPVVFLQGDRLGVLYLNTGAFAVPEGEKDINTDDLMRTAVSLSKQAKIPAIYLGRVGVEGSSGDHRFRHSILELQVTNAALDAIKQKYNFEGFHLMGQSGGAHLVAGLLALRQDVGCAVIGSGPLTPVKRSRPPDDPLLEHFNPADQVATIARNHADRIMVITDLADKKVSAQSQTNFVRKLEQTGRAVEQFIVQAPDDNRHGVLVYSRLALTGCLRRASTEEIAQEADKMSERIAASRPKENERGETSKSGAGAMGSGPRTDTVRPKPEPMMTR